MRTHHVCIHLALAASTAGAALAAPLKPGVHPEALAALTGSLEKAVDAGMNRPALRGGRLPPRALVLLVDFSDAPQPAGGNDRAQEDFFGGAGSVRDYYARASHGRYELGGDVHGWVRAPRTLAFYADGQRGIGGTPPHSSRTLVEDAVRAADSGIDFSRFDNDGPDGVPASGDDDGMVDALVVVHAGEAAELTGRRTDLLSHAWTTTQALPTADGVVAWSYALVAFASPLGVRAHEFGHLLGLPDLYNSGSEGRSTPGGLGDWSLMASGTWLGDGHEPADLDGPSKIELGFVDPIVPRANAQGLELKALRAAEAPQVYKVWSHGLPELEYFVIENRRPQPGELDARLPGGGMLVYHVDLRRADNEDRDRPRVRLLQADGREDLENFANAGDAGDPYPGTGSDCCRIGADTQPGTLAADGSPTQVVIASITTPTATMHFDLQLEESAFLRVVSQALRERDGDGDGYPEAGEVLELSVEIENLGLPSAALDLHWRAEPAPSAVWNSDRAQLPGLDKGARATATFVLRPDAGLGDPAAVSLVGEASESSGTLHRLEHSIPLGASQGFQACLQPRPSRFSADCSDPAAAWQVVALGATGSWSLEPSPGDLALVYRSAAGPRYANRCDVALQSPPFNLAPGSELQLLHDYDIATQGAGWAQDGGRVEISLDGGAWEALEPQGGYPCRIWPASIAPLAGAGVFSGHAERRWDHFPLGARSGSARLRFRFASDDSLAAAGWVIARVEVRLPVASAQGTSLRLLAEPNPVRFPTRVAFRIETAHTSPARPTRLLVFDSRGRLVRVLSHAPVPAQSGEFVWDGTDRAGRAIAAGVYFARLEWAEETATTKLLVLR